jgi:rhodanese-related sulfurtransferase
MTVATDPSTAFADYAHPERLVSTEWLQANLGTPGLVVVESDEDVILYETGHIPGAVKIDWHTDLNDPVERDYIDGAAFAALLGRKGISRDSTVVIYGDKSNWWAAYALWVFTLFGHTDVRLLDGGRQKWLAEGREVTTDRESAEPAEYPVVERDDAPIRAYKEDVLAHFGHPLIDVRSPEEYSGERTTAPAYPEEGRSHPVRCVRPVGASGRRRRHLPVPCGAGRHLPRRGRSHRNRAGDRVLPHRRTLQPHLVRAHPPAGSRQRAQLRRLLDRVGQRGAGSDRAGCRARHGATSPMSTAPMKTAVGELTR